MMEIDSSKISEISKFYYVLELVQGKPKNWLLGLPHREKKILEMTFGKDMN